MKRVRFNEEVPIIEFSKNSETAKKMYNFSYNKQF